MNASLEKIALIERFLIGQLSGAVLESVEERIASDKAFAQEVALQRQLMRTVDRVALKDEMKGLHRKMYGTRWGLWIAIAILAAASALGIWWFMNHKHENNKEGTFHTASLHEFPTQLVNQEIEAGFSDWRDDVQHFVVYVNQNNEIQGREGTKLTLPAHCWNLTGLDPTVLEIDLFLVEALDPMDHIKYNLPTVAGNELLSTAGMVYVEAHLKDSSWTKIDLNPAVPMTVELPAKGEIDCAMRPWTLDSNRQWKEVRIPQPDICTVEDGCDPVLKIKAQIDVLETETSAGFEVVEEPFGLDVSVEEAPEEVVAPTPDRFENLVDLDGNVLEEQQALYDTEEVRVKNERDFENSLLESDAEFAGSRFRKVLEWLHIPGFRSASFDEEALKFFSWNFFQEAQEEEGDESDSSAIPSQISRTTSDTVMSEAHGSARPQVEAVAVNSLFQQGMNIFTRDCKTCHTVHAGEEGHNLAGITTQKSEQWLRNFVKHPGTKVMKLHPIYKTRKIVFTHSKAGKKAYSCEEMSSLLTYLDRYRDGNQSESAQAEETEAAPKVIKKYSISSPGQMKSYVMSVGQLGWINCDRFASFASKTNIKVEVSGNEGATSTYVYVLFPELKSATSAQWQKNGETFSKQVSYGKWLNFQRCQFENVAADIPIKVIAFTKVGDQLRLGIVEGKVDNDVITVKLEDVNPTEVQDRLEAVLGSKAVPL